MPGFSVSVTDAGPMLVAALRLPGIPRERVLAGFCDPAVLAQWWGGELITTLVPGSPYAVSFRQLDRAITGEVVAYQPARHLEFTWAWDHEPAAVRRTVLVAVAPAASGGTVLSITHGPYADRGPDLDEAESAARTEHREGWEFFLPRLAALLYR